MLLILFHENIIESDISFIYLFQKNVNNVLYFYPEIRKLLNAQHQEKFDGFLKKLELYPLEILEEKRKIGENDSYICSLIRNDSVEEFIAYTTRSNLSLSSKIKPSYFETNSFLLKNEPTLIEYAAFFGSIQIFQYLRMNDVNLTSSLWKFAIHSHNPELIHLLEEHEVEINENIYERCLIESIKCHHNDFANYFDVNFVQVNENEKLRNQKKSLFNTLLSFFKDDTNDGRKKFISVKIKYCNFALFDNDVDVLDNKYLYSICKYNYYDIAKFFLSNQSIDINLRYIL